MKEKNFEIKPAFGLGISSIVLIFVILSLSTFAVLALSSATADYKLSSKLADYTTQYNLAYTKSEEMLASLDKILIKCYQENAEKNAYYSMVKKELNKKEDGKIVQSEEDELLVSYEINVTDTQNMQLVIKINFPKKETENFYEVKNRKLVYSSNWKAQDSIHVYTK